MPDTRPGSIFDKEGVCQACRNHERKEKTDWEARFKELQMRYFQFIACKNRVNFTNKHKIFIKSSITKLYWIIWTLKRKKC